MRRALLAVSCAALTICLVMPGVSFAQTDDTRPEDTRPASTQLDGTQPDDTQPDASTDPASDGLGRLLVISMPQIPWSGITAETTPNLWKLIDDSAIGNVAVRIRVRRTRPGEGYVAVSAGGRAVGSTNVEGQQLTPTEPIEAGTAAEAYARRFGPLEGDPAYDAAAALSFGMYSIKNRNARYTYDGRPGLLADSLLDAGLRTGVVANADREIEEGEGAYRREAAFALTSSDGLLSEGTVDRSLLQANPQAAWGVEYNHDSVLGAVDQWWNAPGDGVLLVELSDIIRADAYGRRATGATKAQIRADALSRSDELLGRLLERVDPATDGVLVVGPGAPSGQTRMPIAVMRAPGVEPGYLDAASTRRTGVVMVGDIGPTILDMMGVDRPAEMEGRPFVSDPSSTSTADRVDYLVSMEAKARFRDALVNLGSLVLVVLELIVLAAAVWTFRRRDRSGRSLLGLLAFSVVGTLPMTYLSALLPFERYGENAYWAFVLGGGLAIGLIATLLERAKPLWGIGFESLVILVVILGNVVFFDSILQLSTVFGDSPIVAGRFTGINNVSFAQVMVASITLACIIARSGERKPWKTALGLGVLLITQYVIGSPAYGADVGGILAGVPAFFVTAWLILGWPLKWRHLLIALAATAVAVAGFVAIDFSRPSEDRSHLGRLFEQIGGEGFGALSNVISRKLEANLSVLTGSQWTLLVVASTLLALWLWRWAPGQVQRLRERLPAVPIATAGLLVAATLGWALNDSGVAVPGMMLSVYAPFLVVLWARFE
ncbi:MAG: hypothetical protein KDB86_11175 [Actinobacteria bacterium]|nr:hypothetical protein [Actinomycetota bacterium]